MPPVMPPIGPRREMAGRRQSPGLCGRTGRLVKRFLAVGVLTLLLCLGVFYLYLGGEPFSGDPGWIGYVAMAIGLLAAIVLGVGLVLLILRRKPGD